MWFLMEYIFPPPEASAVNTRHKSETKIQTFSQNSQSAEQEMLHRELLKSQQKTKEKIDKLENELKHTKVAYLLSQFVIRYVYNFV